MTMRSYPKARTEYRMVCSDSSHMLHAYEFKSLEAAKAAVQRLQDERDPDNEIPYKSKCWPWEIEKREVSSWSRV